MPSLQMICGKSCLGMSNFTDRLKAMSSEKQQYILAELSGHLAKVELQERLLELVTNFEFIEAKKLF